MGGYPHLYSFNENEFESFTKAFEKSEDDFRAYLKNIAPSITGSEVDEITTNVKENSVDVFSGKRIAVAFAESCLESLVKLGRAKKFDISEYFSHYEFLYYWDYMKKTYANCKDEYEYTSRYITGPNAKSYRLALPKGMLIFEALFEKSIEKFLGISLDTDYFFTYASAKSLQESGRDAVHLLKNVSISEDEPMLKNLLELGPEDKVSPDWLDAFLKVRDMIADAIEYSVQKNHGLALIVG